VARINSGLLSTLVGANRDGRDYDIDDTGLEALLEDMITLE
jgi:hypothetical protein